MRRIVLLLVVAQLVGSAALLNLGNGQESERQNRLHFSGQLSTKYRAQWNKEDTDHDLLQYLSFDLTNIFAPGLSLHGFMRGGKDVDDKDPIFDWTDYEVQDRIYDLYFEADKVIPRTCFRLGRQYHDGLEAVQFDGLSFMRTESDWLSWEVFGGRYVTFYNRDFGQDCSVGGAEVTARPFRSTSLSAEYLRLMNFPTGDDDYLNFGLRQRLNRLNLLAKYSLLNGEAKDISAKVYWDWGKGWQVGASYYRLLQTLQELSNEFDPYYPLFGPYVEFDQYGLDVTKSFGQHFSVTAGYAGRNLPEGSLESIANREFDRYHATLLLSDVLTDGLSFSATLDKWLAGWNEDTYSVGGEIAYSVKKKLDISAGSYYSKYKYDIEAVTERIDVRTWYGALRYYFSRKTYVSLRGEREDDHSPESPYGKVEMRVTFKF